ncbi:MAG TPA: hypothetical protein VLQ93_03025 [Myxococcaceae bacterium]|nr:hypothetical protein [Myxococcaceae bacterium]
MRRTGWKPALLGVLGAATLLAGCEDYDDGRRWSLTAQEDYYPIEAHEGTVEPFGVPVREEGIGGAGERLQDVQPEEGVELGFPSGDIEAWTVGTRQEQEQGFRTVYPPPEVAMPLGTGKPLRVGRGGEWIQGTYAVELGQRADELAPSGMQQGGRQYGVPGRPLPQPQRGKVGESPGQEIDVTPRPGR